MSQLIKKFIQNNAVDETKIRLSNNASLKARNAANSGDINILKVNASDAVEFSSVPQVSSDPSNANDLARKSYVDGLEALDLRLDGSRPMEADLDMDGNKIVNLADPSSNQDAATKKYVDDLEALDLRLDGSRSMSGDLDFDGNKGINLADPSSNQDAATKKYVDDSITAIDAATQELDNLTTTAINADLNPDTDSTYDLGQAPVVDTECALLASFDGNLTDESFLANTLASSGTSFVAGHFSQAVSIPGGAAYVRAPNTAAMYDLAFKSFTIEGFVSVDTVGTDQTFAAYSDGSALGWEIVVKANGSVRALFLNTSAGTAVDMSSSAGLISSGVYSHIAVVRSGGTFRLFVDGVLEATASSGDEMRALAASFVYLGCEFPSSQPLTGKIDEFRFSIGNINSGARYSATFTPPAAPFSASTPGNRWDNLFANKVDASAGVLYLSGSSINASSKQIKSLADPSSNQDAATKKYADDLEALDLRLDGSRAMSDDLDFGGNNGINMANPTSAQHAATKAYVDAVAQGLKPKAAVRAASLADVDISDELEDGDSLDGVTLATGDRVLLKDQTDPSENGIYVVVASGAASRSTDFDSLTPIDEINGAYTFVREGSQAGVAYVVSDAVAVLGTDPINFVYFNSAGSLSGGDMITISSNIISVDLAASGGLESTNPGNAAGQLRIKLEASNPSLKFSGSNELGVKLDAAGAIASGASGLAAQVDGSTLEINTNALRVKAAGITGSHLNTSVAGAGLAGGGGSALSVNVDDSTIEINSDALRVKDAGITLAKLASNSVDENKLTTSVAGNGLAGGGGAALSVNVDGSTLEINADALRVKDLGISTAKLADASVTADKLAAAVAGSGLAGGAGSALSVNVDDSTIEINSDTLRLKDAGVTSAKLATNSVVGAKVLMERYTITLNGTDITNQYFEIDAGEKLKPESIIFQPRGGMAQEYGRDYDVDNSGAQSQFRFDAVNLPSSDLATGAAAALVSGDVITVVGIRL